MNTQRPIEKLVIVENPPFRPDYIVKYCDGGESWCGTTPEQAEKSPTKETYTGAAAIRKLWEIEFERLDETDKKLICAVFPNVDKKDEITLKYSPADILRSAIIKARKVFGVACPRCGGDGHYPSEVDNGVCHKCGGRGVVMPRLTDKKLAEIAKHFSGVAE